LVDLRQNHYLWDALKLLETDEHRLNIQKKAMGGMHQLSWMLRILGAELGTYYMKSWFGASTIKDVAAKSRGAFNGFYKKVKSAN